MVGNISFRIMIFHAGLILTAIKISAINAECVDTEPFKFGGNENTMCAGQDCSKNKVVSNCPLTCGKCVAEKEDDSDSGSDCVDIEPFTFKGNDDNFCAGQDCSKNKVAQNCPLTCGSCSNSSGGGSGDGSGSGSGGGEGGGESTCKDNNKKFKVKGKSGKKKCKKWNKLCGKNDTVDSNCPKTCNKCVEKPEPPPCNDVSGKFKYGKTKKTCKQVKKKKKKFCKKNDAQVNCPVTCGTCANKITTPSPTPAPSASPTATPSASPTATPSASPTATPSATPSQAPSRSTCTIVGTIFIPLTDSLGFHSASLRVSKSSRNVICDSHKRKTGWGCVHEGGAKVGSWNDDTIGCQESETATIEYAQGGVFNFTMNHVFDDKELYYKEDHKIRPELTISVNEVLLDTIKYPANKNTDTHLIDGSVNGAYQGIVFGNVACDEECTCIVERVLPECSIRAEIQFPALYSAPTLLGYQNDAISVLKDGKDDSCSSDERVTKWCVHEGDAEFYSSYGDDYYHDISSTESIVIPEAKNGNFLFKIEHDMSQNEEYYYGEDYNVTGEVQLWVDGKDKGSHGHWFKDTYLDTFYLDVKCDDACKCEIEHKKNPFCKIEAKVKFPNKENMNYYGYQNEYVVVQKGGEAEKCEWENLDETSWGCLHDGGDAYVWYHNKTYFEKATEMVTIDDGAEGEFRFTLKHWASNLDTLYPDDKNITGVMTIAINDKEPLKFSLPVDDIDTYLSDGTINPEYKGTMHVDVRCDGDCHCDIVENAPTSCELNAELSLPEFKEDYYGYNSDIVKVKKEGEDEECGYYTPLADWGCFSSGDAYIVEYVDDSYYDLNGTQIINIVDASNSTFIFTVEYFYMDLSNNYLEDYKHKSKLEIDVGGTKETFKHKRNDETDTSDPEYTSSISVSVTCDATCACSMEKNDLLSS